MLLFICTEIKACLWVVCYFFFKFLSFPLFILRKHIALPKKNCFPITFHDPYINRPFALPGTHGTHGTSKTMKLVPVHLDLREAFLRLQNKSRLSQHN